VAHLEPRIRSVAEALLDAGTPDGDSHAATAALSIHAATTVIDSHAATAATNTHAATAAIDPHAATAAMDFVQAYANPLSVTVICEMLGVPLDQRDAMNRHARDALLASFAATGMGSAELRAEAEVGLGQLMAILDAAIERHLAAPTDNIISTLVAEESRGTLNREELRNLCALLLIGGHETTANMIASGAYVLAETPSLWARLKADPARTGIKAHTLPDAALAVPVMCNLGTKEGVTVKGDRFSGVWPANEAFFAAVRGKGGLVGVAVDPLTSHECGNQRYLAIPWLDACLADRLPKTAGPLNPMPVGKAWLAPVLGGEAVPAAKFAGDPLKAAWLPNEAVAQEWTRYVTDTKVADTTPPPAPTNLRVEGNVLTWDAAADPESGLAKFVVERDGKELAEAPGVAKNPFGRPVFQGVQYSDTPALPLVPLRFTDATAEPGGRHTYRVVAVNTAGLRSAPSAAAGR
ncbi:MAG: cytochrome P450, partial [Rhodospirillales bacterium]|nr:cytochrome P450 [Rhodospirillales bacterium]